MASETIHLQNRQMDRFHLASPGAALVPLVVLAPSPFVARLLAQAVVAAAEAGVEEPDASSDALPNLDTRRLHL